jgi:hypothetical protein
MAARSALVLGLLLAVVTAASASETALTGREGHPRARFPLTVWTPSFGEPALDAAVRRAVDDWNALARDVLGVAALAWSERRDGAHVTLAVAPADASRLMGATELSADARGVIALPVRIVVYEPAARGQTSRETLLYQVVAHELGHALGLPHTGDPRSLMCCATGAARFDDAAWREAYVAARRHPDVRSVREQLAAQYARVWARPE